MIRWLIYLLSLFIMSVIAIFLTPILPAFASPRMGPINNNHGQAVEPRLPVWLSWFDTPDNSLLGDASWRACHNGGYWSQVAWLYRNSLYGFKWGPLAAPMSEPRIIRGDPNVNCNNGHFGTLRITMGVFWQWKCVKRIGQSGHCWMLNFGWMLNDVSQKRALFMFSPRCVKIRPPAAMNCLPPSA